MSSNSNKKGFSTLHILFICMIASLLLLGSTGCSTGHSEAKKDASKDTIIVGTSADFPPFEALDKNGRIYGFDIDLIHAIGDELGAKIELQNLYLDELIPMLKLKKIDVAIAALTITKNRDEQVYFTKGYYKSKQAMIVGLNNSTIKGFADLKGKKLGTVIATTGNALAAKIKGVEHYHYNGIGEALDALEYDKIDAIIIDESYALNLLKYSTTLKVLNNLDGKLINEEEYAIAISPAKPALYMRVQKALQTIKDNGTYERLLKKWF